METILNSCAQMWILIKNMLFYIQKAGNELVEIGCFERSCYFMKKRRMLNIVGSILIGAVLIAGCGRSTKEEMNPADDNLAENVILTETGEVVEKEEVIEPDTVGVKEETAETKPTPIPISVEPEIAEGVIPIKPSIELSEPQKEQIITEEDQVEPTSNEMQLVFLGDSIFDFNRDGTGVPYLTALQCEADVYNLAIGGTSAAIEWEESQEYEKWTSTSLCGIVNVLRGAISSDVFEGKRAKEILDNPNIDFSQTDYFIVEYGMNDYFRAVPLDIPGTTYDLRCYAGALRYAVTVLSGVAPDATIILCAPNYAQFYNGEGYMLGDGNSLNTGYGTLFDYKGICNYIANEQQTLFLNAYQDLGIDGYTADQYLEDGVHLSQEGRQLYADALAKMILEYEETKNN